MKTATPKNIDEYIAGFPRGVQETLQKIRDIIRDAAPDAEETIKYRMPTFVLHGNLVHFAGFQKHIGFYPTPSAIEAFSGELAGYESAKGSVQFPLNKSAPFSLIRKMIEYEIIFRCNYLIINNPTDFCGHSKMGLWTSFRPRKAAHAPPATPNCRPAG
jgi:uncharacterized protein YdhG (YjbR/CyaY superfamily)